MDFKPERLGGGLGPKGAPQLQVIGTECADKAPNFGAEGAEIFEKTVLFNAKIAIFGRKSARLDQIWTILIFWNRF